MTAAGSTADSSVLSPSVGDLIASDSMIWEREPMEQLARGDDLRAYVHPG